MATKIYDFYKDDIPVFIGVMNGSFMFVSDFMKYYPGQCEVSFIKLASYDGLKSSDDIQRLVGISQNLSGRKVIILEDIIDSGRTLNEIYRIFNNKKGDNLSM